MTLSQPKDRVLTVNDLRLHYLDWGDADAPPVVCVHGFSSSAHAFNALARRFEGRFHFVVPDVRGHGESAWSPAEVYQYRDQVADLEGIVDHLAIRQFALIGTSMGGIIAMAYAGAHPQRVAGLVINDIGPDEEEGSRRITRALDGRPERFATLDDAMAFRRWMSPIVAGRSVEDQRELALGVLREQPDESWVWKMDPAYIRQRLQHGAPPRPALWPVLQSLPCPTLVLWGTESDVLGAAQARRMVELLPRGELVAVPGVGHTPTLVEPAALAGLERFLTALRYPASA